jgi:hypothetical protein
MAANSRAIIAADMKVKDLLKANQGRKALCATMRVLKSVKHLTIKDKAKLCGMANASVCKLYVNIVTGMFNKDDENSFVNLFQTRTSLLFYNIPWWFQEVVDDDTCSCDRDFCQPEEKELQNTKYISAMAFILYRMSLYMDENIHHNCFEELQDVIRCLGILTATEPLEQFFSLTYDYCLPTDQGASMRATFGRVPGTCIISCTWQTKRSGILRTLPTRRSWKSAQSTRARCAHGVKRRSKGRRKAQSG